MTNYEFTINKLGVEGLAALLVYKESIDEGSKCCDGEWESHWIKQTTSSNKHTNSKRTWFSNIKTIFSGKKK